MQQEFLYPKKEEKEEKEEKEREKIEKVFLRNQVEFLAFQLRKLSTIEKVFLLFSASFCQF